MAALKKIPSQAVRSLKSMNPTIVFLLLAAIVILVLFAVLNASMMYTKKGGSTMKYTNEQFSDKDLFQIIYTYHKTCPHCIRFNDTFDLVAKSFAQNVTSHDTEVMKIEKSNIPAEYMTHIDGFPTVLIYMNKMYKTKAVGNMSSQEFAKFLENALQE